jgi:hypothetical protein
MKLKPIFEWTDPFLHYTFSNFFDEDELSAYKSIDPHGNHGNELTRTRTSSKNRIFIDDNLCKTYEIYRNIRDFFVSKETIELFESYVNKSVPNYLRLEVIKDTGESWLEPHCDIMEKYVSFLLFINDSNENPNIGTDLYSSDLIVKKTVPFIDNTGYFFYPGKDTWHGLEKKKIKTHRKILMMNYVEFNTEIKLK